jgi:hypothetical protein
VERLGVNLIRVKMVKELLTKSLKGCWCPTEDC